MLDAAMSGEGGQNTAEGEQMAREKSFTVRFWDYSQKPSNRTPRKSLKTIDRQFSTRKKFRFSHFACVSLFAADVTLLHLDFGALPAPSLQRQASRIDGHAVPSIFAVTPAASTKVEKLMGTLSACFATRTRQPKVAL